MRSLIFLSLGCALAANPALAAEPDNTSPPGDYWNARTIIFPPRIDPEKPNSRARDIYPVISRTLGEQGSVILLLSIDETGKVTEAQVDTSSGFARLDAAAIQAAVQTWRFLPGTIDGKPAVMQYKIKLEFTAP